ncbi:hypothetical protein PR048_011728 [Dryococelus australis]|uniref:Uncharacterized protein n=1 Tax=Dryococelus australis TaxID=614101 RepID=A0ABQ9HML4_9NEOP|nr:hypothetical protein PR048_011728 [Dryococelus australis]
MPDLKRQGTIQGTANYLKSYYLSSEAVTRQVVKVPEEESRKQVTVKATNIQGAKDTARPVVSGEARSIVVQPFDQDTPPRDSQEESPFRGFPTDGRGKVYSKAEEEVSTRQRKHVA